MHRNLPTGKAAHCLNLPEQSRKRICPLRDIWYTVFFHPPIPLIIRRERWSNNPPNITSHDFLRASLPFIAQRSASDIRGFFPLLRPLPNPLRINLLSETTALLGLRLALHLLRHLDVDLEELAHAAVQAHGLALVQVGFAVLGRDAFLGAGVDESVVESALVRWCHLGAHTSTCKGTDATYWLNMLETISISASAAAIFSAEEGWGRPWPKRKDIFGMWCVWWFFLGEGVCVCVCVSVRCGSLGCEC
jgi:hypothetical protein